MVKVSRTRTARHTITIVDAGVSVRATVETTSGIQVYNEYFSNVATATAEANDFAAYYAAKH